MQKIQRFPFTSILGWSSSRYSLFSICKRRYYYQYYAKFDPEIPRAEIDFLKALTSVPLEIGVIVHHVIRALLLRLQSTQAPIDEERFFDFARSAVSKSIEDKVFSEVHYAVLEQIGQEELYPKIEGSLENLLRSARYPWLIDEVISTSAAWIIDPPGYGETRINDLKAYVKVDFLFPLEDLIYIMDWKTGKRDLEKHRKQLVGYATWAATQFDVEPDRIRPAIAYLQPDYEEIAQELNEFDLEGFAGDVKHETKVMYAYCSDVQKNVPLEKAEFPLIEDQRICSHCNYRGICYPELYPMSQSN